MSGVRPVVRRAAAVLALGVILAGGEALAQRPDTRNLTCKAAQDLVARQGSITLSTGRNTFDRFVANSRACGIQNRAGPAYVPTSDNARCQLQTCRRRHSSDGNR